MRQMVRYSGFALIALLAAACGPKPAETPAAQAPASEAPPVATAPGGAVDPAAYLAAPTRPVADAADDAARKPSEVLSFATIAPGQTVLELEAGSGYYTELLSMAVGPGGKVIMQNPPEFDAFAGEAVAARLANNRLANVTLSKTHFDQLEAADGSVDVVTWFLGPHELYYKPEGAPAGLGDPKKAYAEIFRVLKPGGYFVVLDHAAAQGAPLDVGNTLHRIDPAQVRAAGNAAGFTIEEESDLLANPADDHAKGVFDDSIRRKTDQFLFRFVKPAA